MYPYNDKVTHWIRFFQKCIPKRQACSSPGSLCCTVQFVYVVPCWHSPFSAKRYRLPLMYNLEQIKRISMHCLSVDACEIDKINHVPLTRLYAFNTSNSISISILFCNGYFGRPLQTTTTSFRSVSFLYSLYCVNKFMAGIILIHDGRVCSEGILSWRHDGRVCKIKFLHCRHDVVVPVVKKIVLVDTTVWI
jgi:hypothetical protein